MGLPQLRLRRWALVRISSLAILSLGGVYVSFWTGLASSSYSFVVELFLLGVGLFGLYLSGIIRRAQSHHRLALAEIIAVGLCLTVITWLSEGRSAIPSLSLRSLSFFALVGAAEETLCRGYFLGEIQNAWKSSAGFLTAIFGSIVLFMALHVPLLTFSGSYPSLESNLSEYFVAGLVLGLIYVLSDYNLLLVVGLHFYFDSYGLLLPAPVPSFLVSFGVPLIIVVAFRGLAQRITDSRSPYASRSPANPRVG